MDNALVKFLVAVHLVWWPIARLIDAVRIILSPLLRLAVFILSPIWIVGSFLVLPFVHLASGLYHIITLPLQVQWLERIETLYIYLGTAGLIGCISGAVIYFIFKFLSSSLNIDGTSRIKPRKGRTIAEFRAVRRERQDQMITPRPPPPAVVDKTPGHRRRDLLSQTIFEEDSDF